MPTLVLCGTEDSVTPPALSHELLQLIPGAQYEPISGAGHLSNLERPDEFNTLVGAFIRGVDSRDLFLDLRSTHCGRWHTLTPWSIGTQRREHCHASPQRINR